MSTQHIYLWSNKRKIQTKMYRLYWKMTNLVCAERNAPCQWDLAIDKAKPPASAVEWQGNDQTDMQCQATRYCHHQIQWATCVAWNWGSGPRSEGEKAPLVWTSGMLQWCSQDSLSHTGWGKAEPGRPKMTWKQLTERDCREWKLSAFNPHDRHTWRSGVRSAMRTASQLSGRDPLMWMLPLYLHLNQKSDYDIWYTSMPGV